MAHCLHCQLFYKGKLTYFQRRSLMHAIILNNSREDAGNYSESNPLITPVPHTTSFINLFLILCIFIAFLVMIVICALYGSCPTEDDEDEDEFDFNAVIPLRENLF
uniref:Essential MCU regulator, mitochondrial n=1 Tax=Rhabditophanes sp. KR3021 TaxID=114890 RepID=A0AC35U5G5_9BILA